MQKTSSKSIKFCIATDVHLGHKQNQSIRKNDSFNAFEQVLSISTDQQVDFLLLGGDLFDEVNPTQKTIYKCLDILQYYVQGQGKNNLKAQWTQNPQYKINFQNHNMNIKLPIFTIHGNHDYPSNDFGKLSICDLLHVSNYANYFGKHTDLAEIIVKPVIIQKQGMKMKIAIYGLGYIKDTVLNDLFEQKKVKFQQLQNSDQYFRLFIFHQNRYKKGLRAGAPALKCINSKYIPSWMDLTIWGHEHQAISKIQTQDDRKIFQPGSTVITSFIEAQSYPKQCLMIQIQQNGDIDLNPIPLKKSYRPMICRNIEIGELVKQHKKTSEQEFDFFNYLDNQLNIIINDIQLQFPGRKPIIRIKIQHSGYEISRWRILELKYSQKVANPQSILTFWKRKQQRANDNNFIQLFKSKSDGSAYQQQQISDQILLIYAHHQQNKQVYFDPRQLYKLHQTSINRDLINAKDYLGGHITKQIQRKIKPTQKQLEMIYKVIPKDVDIPARDLIAETLKLINLDGQRDQQEKLSIIDQNKKQIKISSVWQQQKKLVVLKQDEIIKSSLLNNYGDNFFLQDKKMIQEPKNKVNQQKKPRQSGRSTVSGGLSNFLIPNSQKINKPEKMQIQQLQIPKAPKRPGILKNSNSSHSDLEQNHNDEQDCCKKAQRTPYDEGRVKGNFQGAHNMIRNDFDKKNKKNIKQKQVKKVIKVDKKKKSIRWDDQQSDDKS